VLDKLESTLHAFESTFDAFQPPLDAFESTFDAFQSTFDANQARVEPVDLPAEFQSCALMLFAVALKCLAEDLELGADLFEQNCDVVLGHDALTLPVETGLGKRRRGGSKAWASDVVRIMAGRAGCSERARTGTV
jgi:hypothetical protein